MEGGNDLLVRGHSPQCWLWSQTYTGAPHSTQICPDLAPANSHHVHTPAWGHLQRQKALSGSGTNGNGIHGSLNCKA